MARANISDFEIVILVTLKSQSHRFGTWYLAEAFPSVAHEIARTVKPLPYPRYFKDDLEEYIGRIAAKTKGFGIISGGYFNHRLEHKEKGPSEDRVFLCHNGPSFG